MSADVLMNMTRNPNGQWTRDHPNAHLCATPRPAARGRTFGWKPAGRYLSAPLRALRYKGATAAS